MAHRAEPARLFAVDTSADAQRRRDLRRMKAVALGFLVGATAIFLGCRWAQGQGMSGWVGYVGAAAEAGMVGALADWFAVTALFKHPLGIPIPHTAIAESTVYSYFLSSCLAWVKCSGTFCGCQARWLVAKL